MLQGCSCLSGVKTICRHCVAGVQLFNWCGNLSAGTVLQRCSCLSGVETVSQPICRHCVAEVQLFKWCRNCLATYLQALCCRGAAV